MWHTSVRARLRRAGRRPLLPVALLAALGLAAASSLTGPGAHAATSTTPTFVVQDTTPGRAVPASLLGFSIDPAELCSVVALAQTDPAFAQLFENLGPGTFRVGGNTGDRSAMWSTTAGASCVWNKLVMTPALVESFVGFAQSVGYRVTWQVPLANNQPTMDAAEGAFVSSLPDVSAIEIGNEPNYYAGNHANPQPWISAWLTTYQDYVADGGTAPVTGPAATTTATVYSAPFLAQAHADLAGFTGHFYAGSAAANPRPSCSKLLSVSALKAQLTAGVGQAAAYGLPFFMNETNSFSGGGVAGASNAFCSALWASDYALLAMSDGAQGIYFHGVDDSPTGNSKGLLQYYTPINADGSVAPEYYGLLFADQMIAAGGNVVAVAPTSPEPTLDAYATTSGGVLRVALFNRGASAQTVAVQTTGSYGQSTETALSAPSVTSLSGVTLDGGTVGTDGTWAASPSATAAGAIAGNTASVSVPAYSAVLVTLTPVSAPVSPSASPTTGPTTPSPTTSGSPTVSPTPTGSVPTDPVPTSPPPTDTVPTDPPPTDPPPTDTVPTDPASSPADPDSTADPPTDTPTAAPPISSPDP